MRFWPSFRRMPTKCPRRLLATGGRAAYDAEPGRFRRARMAAYRESLADQLHQLDDQLEQKGQLAASTNRLRRGTLTQGCSIRFNRKSSGRQVTPILEVIARDQRRGGGKAAPTAPGRLCQSLCWCSGRESTPGRRRCGDALNNIAYPSTPWPAEQTVLLCYVASAGMLAHDNELSLHLRTRPLRHG